jgi:hypothetical protein
VKRGSALELRPCLGQGAPWRARVGRVRNLAFLNIPLMATGRASLVAQGDSVVYTLLTFALHHHPSF